VKDTRGAPAAPLRLRIDSIGAGGEGVGRLPDGRVVFVHRTAPGDVAEVEVVQRGKRWARGRLLRVLEPSPERREPPCRFYAECGGCTLEHLEYPAQLRAKSRIVVDALVRIGKLDVHPPVVVASPREHRYRNRVSFALRRLGQGRVVAGFHALGEPDRIVDIDGTLPPVARYRCSSRAGSRRAGRTSSSDRWRGWSPFGTGPAPRPPNWSRVRPDFQKRGETRPWS